MPEINTGMGKQAMKDLLLKSKKTPVNCAFGDGVTSGYAQLLLDKVKQPRALDADLSTAFPKVKNTRFGTASVDVDTDPKLVKFVITKEVSGMAKKLVKTVKPAGFTKVVIMTEDGKQVDRDEEALDTETNATAGANLDVGGENTDSIPEAPPPPPADPAMLKRDLAALIGRIALIGDPARKVTLAKHAANANEQFKAGDLDAMSASIDALRAQLEARTVSAQNAPVKSGAMVAYAKSRLAWLAARQRVGSEIERLRGELIAAFNDHPDTPELDQAYQQFVGPVLSTFDESLADTLDQAMNATDPSARGQYVQAAQTIIARYTAYLDSTPAIAALDENPLVPLTIRQTLGGTLAALSRAIV